MATDPEIQAILERLGGGGGAATGKFTWTPPPLPGAVQIPTSIQGGVTARMLGRLGVGTAGPGQYTTDSVGAVLQGMSAEQWRSLQQSLYNAGAYPNSYYGRNAKPLPWGQVGDMDTLRAFYTAASFAERTGNLDQILAAKAPIGAMGAAGPVRQPLVIELPSVEDLNAVLKEAAMPLIGREPTAQEMADFAKRFRDQSASYQRQAYAAGGSGLPGGPGGTVQRPPAASSAAQEFLRQRAPVEAGAQGVEEALGILTKMWGAGA